MKLAFTTNFIQTQSPERSILSNKHLIYNISYFLFSTRIFFILNVKPKKNNIYI